MWQRVYIDFRVIIAVDIFYTLIVCIKKLYLNTGGKKFTLFPRWQHFPVDHLKNTSKLPRSDTEIEVRELIAGDTKTWDSRTAKNINSWLRRWSSLNLLTSNKTDEPVPGGFWVCSCSLSHAQSSCQYLWPTGIPELYESMQRCSGKKCCFGASSFSCKVSMTSSGWKKFLPLNQQKYLHLLLRSEDPAPATAVRTGWVLHSSAQDKCCAGENINGPRESALLSSVENVFIRRRGRRLFLFF